LTDSDLKITQETFFKFSYNLALIKKRFHIYNCIGFDDFYFIQDLTMINILKYMNDLNAFNKEKILKFFLMLTEAALPLIHNSYRSIFVYSTFQKTNKKFLMQRYRGYENYFDIFSNIWKIHDEFDIFIRDYVIEREKKFIMNLNQTYL